LANPNDGDAHAVLAKAQNVQGDYQKAIDEATKALEAGSNNVEALNARSYAQNNLGHPKSALMDADMAIALAPANPLARLNRAQALETLGQIEPAMKDYQRAARLNPAFKKAFESAYARNSGKLGGGGPGRMDGVLSGTPGKVGAGLVVGAGLLGFLGLRRPKPPVNGRLTTGVLKALGTVEKRGRG
jgi:tetratricopeptide (TPR) repeat protein